MKNSHNISSGLSFTVRKSTDETKKERAANFLLSALLFIGLAGGFYSMLGLNLLPYIKKLHTITWANMLTDGFPILFNRLFAVSEACQAYKYNMFPVSTSVDFHEIYMLTAFLILSAICMILCAFAAKNRWIFGLLAVAFIFVQIYFGVFPSAGWNVILCLSVMLIAACKGRSIISRGIILLVIYGAIFLVVQLTFQGPDSALSELSEQIRDQFDEQLENPAMGAMAQLEHLQSDEEENLPLNSAEVSDEPYRQAKADEFSVNRSEKFQGADIGETNPAIPPVVYLIIIIAVLILSAAIRLVLRFKETQKRRESFMLLDYAAAINNIFLYSIDWLKVYGLNEDNIFFSSYFDSVSDLISPEYSVMYIKAVKLWQEAVYSSHAMTAEQREGMLGFLEATKVIILENSNFINRLKIKVKLFF